ncbi:MAG: hypothetical protein CXX72_00530 [Methanobacteriota archaeon]|nr:MAG: hypothetical protein CXX72_00530 [Euryarchaeota archaeon]
MGPAVRFSVGQVAAALALLLMLVGSALAYSAGPPESNNAAGDSTATYGCTCHGAGAPSAGTPSTEVVVSISGVPHSYDNGTAYNFTIKVQHSSNTAGGFLLSSGGVGTFSWTDDDDIRPADGSDEPTSANSTSANISHSSPATPAEWTFTWTAPAADEGDVTFWLAGNSVDGGGANDDSDHWNLLSFVVNEPGATDAQSEQGLATRVISVGDYDSLFVSEEDPEQLERERQAELADGVFSTGNTLYFTSLLALIIGAVFQREFLERKRGEGPPWLPKELAYPQGLRRGITAALFFLLGLYWMSNDEPTYLTGPAIFVGFWAAYGVYRTARATRQQPTEPEIA